MSLRTPRGASFSTSAAAALAAVSVAVAIWLSLQPQRIGDLHRVALWTSQWVHGTHLYGPASDVDYPPWAIVTLAPLGAVPAGWLPWLWGAVNLIALRFVAGRLTSSRGAIFFLLIAAGTIRTLNQFSLVSVALAVAGTTAVSPLSPLWLGLSLMKPQIGLVFWLHALWQRQWRLALLSAVVPLLLTVVYAAQAHVPVLDVPAAYAQSIHVQYDIVLWGQTEITSALRTAWPSWPAAWLAVLVAVAAFAPFAIRRPQLGFAVASLLAFRHLSYDLILLLPWVATLEGAGLWLAVLLLVADPSAIAGLLVPDSALARHADRLMLCAVWACGLVAFVRSRRRSAIDAGLSE